MMLVAVKHENGQTFGMDTFGQRMRRRRESLGITQDGLAERLGMDRGHINKIETGRIGRPTLPVANRIAAALDTTADALYGQPVNAGWIRDLPPNYSVLDFDEDELVLLARALSDDDRRRLLVVARAFYQMERSGS